MNIDYWTSIAQISATFTGLVFVGITLYIGSIREATKYNHSQDPTEQSGIGADLEEVSSRLMIALVFSNLTYFAMPLVISLCIIARSEQVNADGFFLAFAFVTMIALFIIHEISATKKQFREVMKARSRDFLYRLRLREGKWILYFSVMLSIVVILLLSLPGFNARFLELFLEVLSFGMLVIGLLFGFVDIMLFDVKQILFRISDEASRRFVGMKNDLTARMGKLEKLYAKYIVLTDHYLECETGSPAIPPGELFREREEVRMRIERFRQEVPASDGPRIFKDLEQMNGYITLKEALVLKQRWDPLSEGIDRVTRFVESKVRELSDERQN